MNDFLRVDFEHALDGWELVALEHYQSPDTLPHPSLWDCVSSRYQTGLVLVRVKQEEGGFYTIRTSNEDDEQELSFHLQINGEDGHANMGLWSESSLRVKMDLQAEASTPLAVAPECFELQKEHSSKKHAHISPLVSEQEGEGRSADISSLVFMLRLSVVDTEMMLFPVLACALQAS